MTSPLKIVHYSIPLKLEHGGVVRAILDMATAQAAAGHDVVVATWDRTDVPDSWAPGKAGVPRVVEVPPPSRFGKLAKNAEAALKRAIGSCDVVHLHTPWETSNARVAKLCKGLGKPYIISVHGMLDDWSIQQRKLKKLIYLALSARKLLEDAHAVHCAANAELRQSSKWYPGGNPVAIPLLFDLDPYRDLPGPDLARKHYSIPPGRPTVLFVGRVHSQKGVHTIVEAAGTLINKGLELNLLIAGTGPAEYEQQIREQIKSAGHEEYIKLLGMVSGKEKVSLYEAADLFALPTEQENFGFVLTESLACRTPVITTPGVGIGPDLAEAGTAVIVPKEPAPFAEAIEQLLDDDDLRRGMGDAGRAWVLKNLDPAVVQNQYESLYREAARL